MTCGSAVIRRYAVTCGSAVIRRYAVTFGCAVACGCAVCGRSAGLTLDRAWGHDALAAAGWTVA